MSNCIFETQYEKPYPFERMGEKKLPKRYWQMRYLFRELIQNHKKCPYLTILKKNCPVRFSRMCSYQMEWLRNTSANLELGSSTMQTFNDVISDAEQCSSLYNCSQTCKITIEATNSPSCLEYGANKSTPELVKKKKTITHDFDLLILLKLHSSVWQVYSFVRECLQNIVPEELWGSSHNKWCFLKNVKNIIYSVKYEKISLSEIMWKVRVEDCTWIRLVKNSTFELSDSKSF
ncbi:telomerase reverse transcriptase-like [Pelobates fuscus]|uniref:telomerase reverse transcriptase-like n=1 Tax=Pelobates fuscus TaxID=191477 RepID=UPI002FE449E7